MNASEREQLQALIEALQSGQRVTVEMRVAAVNFLRGYQHLAARVAGEWNVAKELEAKYASIL